MGAEERGRETKRVVSNFANELAKYISSSEITQLAFGRISLADTDLGYKPEAFVRHNLVHPLLDVGGLDYQVEPVSDTHQKTWTDFDLTNTDMPFIGEVKPINSLDGGEQEIRSYLGEEGFDTPYGILTDGLEWRFFGPRIGREPGYECLKRLHLNDCLLLAWENERPSELNTLAKSKLRSGVNQAEEFGNFVSRDSLDAWALERLPGKVRREYQSDGRSLQASLSQYWRRR